MERFYNDIYHMEGLRYQHVFALYTTLNLLALAFFPLGLSITLSVFPVVRIRFLAIFPRLAMLIIISLIPAAFSGFNVISENTARIIIGSMYAACIYYSITSSAQVSDEKDADNVKKRSFLQKFKIVYENYRLKIFLMFSLALVGIFYIPIITSNSCVTYFNHIDGGFYFADHATMNTAWVRSLFMPPACPPGAPCHVYATLPSNTSSSVFINAHTSTEVEQVEVYFDTKSHYNSNKSLRRVEKSANIPMENVDAAGRRIIHSTLLDNLEAETDYVYEIRYKGEVQHRSEYRTLPAKGSQTPAKIIFGGDMSSAYETLEMFETIQKQKPDLIVIGGDFTYDNGLLGCWNCWDQALRIIDYMNSELGRTIPFIIALGNHDVGFNTYAKQNISYESLPYWFTMLPQHLPTDLNGALVKKVPSIQERNTYFYHLVGDMVIFSLDSHYVHHYDDPIQLDWLNKNANQFSQYGKIAIYHSPLYPGNLRLRDPPVPLMELGQRSWTPIFEKFKFNAVFENHFHGFKQTKPLKGGKVDEKDGIIYYGDGSMGVNPGKALKMNREELFEVRNRENHVWVTIISGKQYEIFPISRKGGQMYRATKGSI